MKRLMKRFGFGLTEADIPGERERREAMFRANSRSGYVKRESRHCPHCMYIGPRHLCGCMGKLGKALKQGDLDAARAQYQLIVKRANDDLQSRTVWDD